MEINVHEIIEQLKSYPAKDLYSLYTAALRLAFKETVNRNKQITAYKQVLTAIIMIPEPVTLTQLTILFPLNVTPKMTGLLGAIVKRLKPFLLNAYISLDTVLQFHKTFIDYIQSPLEYEKDFQINQTEAHVIILKAYLKLLNLLLTE